MKMYNIDWGMTAHYQKADRRQAIDDWVEIEAQEVRAVWLDEAKDYDNHLLYCGDLDEPTPEDELERIAMAEFLCNDQDYTDSEKAEILDYWKRNLA